MATLSTFAKLLDGVGSAFVDVLTSTDARNTAAQWAARYAGYATNFGPEGIAAAVGIYAAALYEGIQALNEDDLNSEEAYTFRTGEETKYDADYVGDLLDIFGDGIGVLVVLSANNPIAVEIHQAFTVLSKGLIEYGDYLKDGELVARLLVLKVNLSLAK